MKYYTAIRHTAVPPLPQLVNHYIQLYKHFFFHEVKIIVEFIVCEIYNGGLRHYDVHEIYQT
jgi:hypothetical protein